MFEIVHESGSFVLLLHQAQVHDQLIVERLHLRIKPAAERVDNLRRYERYVLATGLNHQLQDLELLRGPCHMMDSHNAMQTRDFPNALFCKHLRVMGMQLSVDDLVFWHGDVGKILICGQEADLFFVILEMWEAVQALTSQAGIFKESTRRRYAAEALEVEMACAWRQLPNEDYIVLRH